MLVAAFVKSVFKSLPANCRVKRWSRAAAEIGTVASGARCFVDRRAARRLRIGVHAVGDGFLSILCANCEVDRNQGERGKYGHENHENTKHTKLICAMASIHRRRST